ncbi:hypothetical protein ACJX0J_006379, partial [Zea mays]
MVSLIELRQGNNIVLFNGLNLFLLFTAANMVMWAEGDLALHLGWVLEYYSASIYQYIAWVFMVIGGAT